MNIFGVGGAELVLIVLIMLIVAGPKRMLRWAYVLGRYTAKLRELWAQVVVLVQQEMDEAGVDVEIPKEIPTRQNIRQWSRDMISPLAEPVQKAMDETRDTVNRAKVDLGTWSEPEKAGKSGADEKKPPQSEAVKTSDFGAWSSPEHPSAQKTQKEA